MSLIGDYDGRRVRTLLVLVMILSFLSSCAAFHQTSTEVFTREPGHRFLAGPKPISVEAQKDWQFAWLSQAAYGRIPRAEDTRADTTSSVAALGASPNTDHGAVACEDADSALLHAGWKAWSDFPDAALANKIAKSNLRVEVWERKEPAAVAVAFGGTIFKSGKDWKSNLRWFIPLHKDEYTEIVKVFGPAFVTEFSRRAKEPGGSYLRDATIYSTGHSLGGGLAQQFAYSLPTGPGMQRVAQVYAFDPSPVTGFYSVDSRTRDINKNGLLIDRIYERGEILAIARSLTSSIYPPSAKNPSVRAVRYSLFYPANPISGHSMAELACKLQVAAGHGNGP